MQSAILEQPGLAISRASGREGPTYDPYHWEEFSVTRNGVQVIYHWGLGEWVRINHPKASTSVIRFPTKIDQPKTAEVEKMFRLFTGFSFSKWMKFIDRLERARYRAHRGHEVLDAEGYPGESMTYCRTCDKVLDYSFNVNAVL